MPFFGAARHGGLSVFKELRPSDPVSVGPYRLLGRLGVGGMGQVYLARSRGGRLVAIKVIRPELAEERGFRARFASEIAAARNVSGVYTAAVVDSDHEAEMPWMATAYVPGPSLADAVYDDGSLPVKTVIALAAGLAEALVAIHGAGVVHRDLKPSNVLLAADGPRVIDFGISLAVERSMLTTTGVVMGSPGFMSPEQARGLREVGKPTDVFSLGAVLAFAATGEGPFGGGSTPALLYRVVNEEPDLARVPARVRPLIERCLAKAPADRPTPADILGLLGDEVGVLSGEWLPKAVADTIGRYIQTIETPPPPPSTAPEPSRSADAPDEADPEGAAAGPPPPDDPATPDLAAREPQTPAAASEGRATAEPIIAAGVPETMDLVGRAVTPDEEADATQDMMASVAATDAVVTGKAASLTALTRLGQGETGRGVPPGEALPQVPDPPDQAAAGTPGGDGLERPLAADVSPMRRWRWPVSSAAAVIVVAVAATILAVEPGGTPKPTSGPTPSLVRITTRPTARHTTTAKPSKTPAAANTKKPARKPSRTASRTRTSPTPAPGYTPSPTYSPSGASTTPDQPPPRTTTPAESGTQIITGVSGANTQSCSAYGSIGSASGGSGVEYTFTNNSGADMQVWFLSSGGSGTLEETVIPNNSFSAGAKTGQDWMVANSGGGCIGIFTITGGGGVTVGS
jgi:eukaryotic-like serine/threonine-protein kinase